MADVRALLAAERQARRITHPHLSYTKSGILLCNVCNLNVKSETLWEGHLRSANHRKNALASQEPTMKPLKRKHEDDDVPQDDRYDADKDGRKKPKSRSVTMTSMASEELREVEGRSLPTAAQVQAQIDQAAQPPPAAALPKASTEPDLPARSQSPPQSNDAHPQARAQAQPEVNEDEWAAFEREVAPLTTATTTQQAPNYEGATITAAPITAAQLAQQADEEKRRRLDTEADDEKEDEGRRLEEEFDVMEEMEERVRKLREKREALRLAALGGTKEGAGEEKQQPTGEGEGGGESALPLDEQRDPNPLLSNETHDRHNNHDDDDNDDDDEDDEDDWYR